MQVVRNTAGVLAVAVLVAAGSLGALAADPAAGRNYQTKAPYQPQQDPATYEAPPAGFSPVFTEMVARHGSRGLSSLKYDLAVTNMWKKASEDGALTELGAKLGPDVLKLMQANFLLGYGVKGISKPGYGNETAVGIAEHKELAARALTRLPALWSGLTAAGARPRQIVVVTSGVDRAVDSGAFFVASLKAHLPALAPLVVLPPAPAPYPEVGAAVAEPDGTNHFLLYFHKLVPATDLVANPGNALYRTYADSQAYQAYLNDPAVIAKQNAALADPAVKAAARLVMERLFARPFLDKIESGAYSFANTGSFTFASADGKFSSTLSGDGKTAIKSLADAASLLYELYTIAPAMTAEAGVDFTPYFPAEQAKPFAYVNDTADFYSKGPGIAERGDITYRIAAILKDDFFNEVDAIAKGDMSHAAKFRFTHAEIIIPFASEMELKGAVDQVPTASLYTYETNPWRGENVSPMAANMQWDVFGDGKGGLLVRMLYNEKETDFKAACDGAKIAPASHFYDYAKLTLCYQHAVRA